MILVVSLLCATKIMKKNLPKYFFVVPRQNFIFRCFDRAENLNIIFLKGSTTNPTQTLSNLVDYEKLGEF